MSFHRSVARQETSEYQGFSLPLPLHPLPLHVSHHSSKFFEVATSFSFRQPAFGDRGLFDFSLRLAPLNIIIFIGVQSGHHRVDYNPRYQVSKHETLCFTLKMGGPQTGSFGHIQVAPIDPSFRSVFLFQPIICRLEVAVP